MAKVTKEEERVIKELQSIAAHWPKSLWLFSANGMLCVVKKKSDGRRAMTGGPGSGFDQDYVVGHVVIENDGGDW